MAKGLIMSNCYTIINHQVNQEQHADLEKHWDVDMVVACPENLAKAWSQIPAGPEYDEDLISHIMAWLNLAQKGDLVLVQGEMTHTFRIVSLCLQKGLIPVAACSQRETIEKIQPDGSSVKTAIFKHVCFRRYVL